MCSNGTVTLTTWPPCCLPFVVLKQKNKIKKGLLIFRHRGVLGELAATCKRSVLVVNRWGRNLHWFSGRIPNCVRSLVHLKVNFTTESSLVCMWDGEEERRDRKAEERTRCGGVRGGCLAEAVDREERETPEGPARVNERSRRTDLFFCKVFHFFNQILKWLKGLNKRYGRHIKWMIIS